MSASTHGRDDVKAEGVRVAMLLPEFSGAGAERVLIDLAQGLRDRSIAVDFVVLRDAGPLRGSLPAGARTVDLGRRHMSTAVPRLISYLRRERPDGVISALNHVNLAAVIANRFVRPHRPLVVTHHNTLSVKVAHTDSRRIRLVPLMARLLFPLADRVVAVSEAVADDLTATTGLRRSRIDVIYNPVVFERIASAAQQPVDHPWLSSKTSRLVVGAGRLIEQKDFGTLIRALAKLPEDVRLIVLGEGEERTSLQRLADELGLHNRVDLRGYVDNPYPYFRAADVFVLSSKWEGLPTVLIEALVLGTRIVSTDVRSGPREILRDGRWGRLVAAQDPDALAAAIRASFDDEVDDRAAARAPYELDRVTARYLDALGLSDSR